jgi:hypothetical protein
MWRTAGTVPNREDVAERDSSQTQWFNEAFGLPFTLNRKFNGIPLVLSIAA